MVTPLILFAATSVVQAQVRQPRLASTAAVRFDIGMFEWAVTAARVTWDLCDHLLRKMLTEISCGNGKVVCGRPVMTPFYEEPCQGGGSGRLFECAPALVGVNVVRPVR